MATKENREPKRDIVVVDAPASVPSYLAKFQEQDESFKDLQSYKVIPRLKIVQNTASGEVAKKFNPGDIILSPGNVLVSAVNKDLQMSAKPFFFVPLYFFTEYCKWADLKDTSAKQKIVERSFDKSAPVSQRALDYNNREEPYGELDKKTGEPKFKYRYIEHMNFPGVIYGPEGHPLKGENVVLCYQRGEFGIGKQFANQCMMRKQGMLRLPLWAQVWELSVGYRDKGPDQKWWGIDHAVPTDPSQRSITEQEAEIFQAAHKELRRAHEDKRIIVDVDNAEEFKEQKLEGEGEMG